MAITGTGTELDPYLVHNYEELKDACEISKGRTMNFVQLANDIDCKMFEWETINLDDFHGGRTGTYTDLNLNNHTIKNIGVKKDNGVFNISSQNEKAGRVRNGKLLNVFVEPNSDNYILWGSATDSVDGSFFENLSISCSMGNGSYFCKNIGFKRCAVYCEGNYLGGPLIHAGYHRNWTYEYSDFLLNIQNQGLDYRLFNTDGPISNCRIRGLYNTGSEYISYAPFDNCVIDLQTNSQVSSHSSSNSGVINSDKLSSGNFNFKGLIGVNSQEIINGSALRNAGLQVVNVVGG